MSAIAVVNGPNLGRLGTREPEIYGSKSWPTVWADLRERFSEVDLEYYQSNHEGELLDFIETLADRGKNGLVINPGALAHQSYALRDCLKALGLPVVEVHLSNVYAREPFRSTSLISPVATGLIVGFGIGGYRLAIEALLERGGQV